MEFDYPEHLNDSNLLIETFFFFLKLTMTITMTVAKTIILFLVKKFFFIS